MADLRVERRRRQGLDRVYVHRTHNGETVAWYDCESGEVRLFNATEGHAVLDALSPYLQHPDDQPTTLSKPTTPTTPTAPAAATTPSPSPSPPPRSSPPPLPRPEADLAANAPGATPRRLLASREPSRLKRALGAGPEDDEEVRSWRLALRGERITGASLNKLRRAGWHILHSIPLPGGTDLDHLAIGPAGVFTVTTAHHPAASVWVGDHAVTVNGQKTDYIPAGLSQAKRVAQLLGAACGFDVEVRPVLAFVGEASRTDETAIPSVMPVDGARAHQRLSGLAPTLPPSRVARLFAAARDPHTWHGA